MPKIAADKMDSSDNNSAEIIRVKQEVALEDNKSLKIVPIYVDENGNAGHLGTTAYTTNTRDKSNILIVKKDVRAIRSSDESASGALPPKALCSHLVKHQPREPTSNEITHVLELWRTKLRETNDYYPDKEKTEQEHQTNLKVLMGARRSFNQNPHNTPVERLMWRHQQYGPIHRQYFIPLDYMAPDLFFEKLLREKDDIQTLYWNQDAQCTIIM
jgi:hypothetical protein